MFIMIKLVNHKITEDRRKAAELRMECWRLKLMQQGRDCERTSTEDVDADVDSENESVDEEMTEAYDHFHTTESSRFHDYLNHEYEEPC
jgi:hypothetical protein